MRDRFPKISSGINFKSIASRDVLIVVFILLLNILLVSPSLMPDFYEINPHDESKYIDSGRSLIDFQFRDLAWGPLVAMIYAPLYLLFRNSLDGFLLEAWAGRFLLFSGLWLSTYYLATQFKDHMHKFVVVGILFVSLPFFAVIENQSDAIYAIFSALGLANLISYYRRKNLRDIWVGSAFVGLAVLSRVEGLILVGLFVLLAMAIGFRRHSLRKVFALSIIPALGIVGGFILISRISTGSFDYSIGSIGVKAYDSFEWNQSILTSGDIEEGQREAVEKFGSKEQNQGSVVRAILNNPSNFGSRILANAKTIPDYFLSMFGKKLGPLILVFAALGVYALIRKGSVPLLAIVIAWSLQSTISLAFLARHLVPQIAYIPLVIGAIGVCYAFGSNPSSREKSGFILLALSLALFGWIDKKFAFMFAGIILTSVFWLTNVFWNRFRATQYPSLIPLLLLFAGGLILRGPYSFPNYPVIGISAEEQAMHYLQENFPSGTTLAAPAPKYAIASKMKDYSLDNVPDLGSAQELYSWLSDHQVDAVYAPSGFLVTNPYIKNLLDEGIGDYFDLAFTKDPGSIQIFKLRDSGPTN